MPTVVLPPYPPELTVAYWNKAKGLLAKASAGETGITARLITADTAFKAAPWKTIKAEDWVTQNVKKTGRDVTPDYVDQMKIKFTKDFQPIFKTLEVEFVELTKFLQEKAVTLSGSIPTKLAAKAVAQMAVAANKLTYAVAWGTISDPQQKYFDNWHKEMVAFHKKFDGARGEITGEINRAEKAVKSADKKMTKPGYEKMWSENLRGIGAKIQQAAISDVQLLKAFKPALDDAKKQWAENGKPKGDAEVPAHLKADLALILKFKQAAGAAGL